MVTVHESRFWYITVHELIWLPPDGEVPDRERVAVQSEKGMLTIVSSPTGFAVVTAFDSGAKFNAGYYVSEVLTPLSEWWCELGGGDFRKLIVHADNARPHKATVPQQFMARNAMVLAVHPPYSPDLAPSDFNPFGHVQALFRGESSETRGTCFRPSRA
jgi:histone-lysine N-methyltransferase SETMAR